MDGAANTCGGNTLGFDYSTRRVNEWFSKFASKVTTWVAKPYFFAGCILLVVLWAPSYFLFDSIDVWQLIINTITTIVTFLLVALLQNDTERFEKATSEKLNAIAMGVGDLLEEAGCSDQAQELYRVMGIEEEIHA